MIPTWLHLVAVISLIAAGGSALIVAVDEMRHPPAMWIMSLVWPLAALFAGPLGLWFYARHGRAGAGHGHHHGAPRQEQGGPSRVAVAKAATHCGAGCTLGDIVAEWLAFLVPSVAVWFGWQTIFSEKIFAVWGLDFVFAFGFGILFQYFTIAPMRGLGLREGLIAALKADALSLTAWQVGMYGVMALAHFWVYPGLLGAPLEVPGAEFWFTMQIAMLAGFVTAYPVNWWLIRSGVKEEM